MLALLQRAFWRLPEVAIRWGCRPEDIAAWATAGQVEISTVVPPIVCGGEVAEGLVTVSTTDLMPMFRRDGGLECGRVRRVRRPDEPDWLYITDPSDGVAVGADDLVLVAAEMTRFEQRHSIFSRPAAAAIAVPSSHPSRYDWDAMVSVRGRGGDSSPGGGVAGVAIEGVGYGGVCRLQPHADGDPDDRHQHAPDRALAEAGR